MTNFVSNIYNSIFPDSKKYLTYKLGKTNIMLSAPHGGNIKPISIPSRTYGNKSRDTYSLDLIKKIIELLPATPYYIYSNIHRSRIDLNRDIVEGCQDNIEMEKLWGKWNNVLNEFSNTVRFFHKKGLYIDIHSHNNSDEFQIGYGLSVKDYLILLDDKKIPTKNSTMHSLKEFSDSEYTSEHSVLFGENSISYNLRKFGYKITIPKNDRGFLNGGRNIKEYSGNGIGALQLECPISVLKYDLDDVAKSIVESINIFSKKFLIKK